MIMVYKHIVIFGYMKPDEIKNMYSDGFRLIGMVTEPAYEREYHFERADVKYHQP